MVTKSVNVQQNKQPFVAKKFQLRYNSRIFDMVSFEDQLPVPTIWLLHFGWDFLAFNRKNYNFAH